MKTENVSTLKIHKLTQAQYDREKAAGNLDQTALYLTPDEEQDLSIYATKEELNDKADVAHTHEISDINELQSKLDEKQKTITGAATSIANSNLTTNRALVSNASGKVIVSAVTSTELGYLDGVTSNVQDQLNGKANDSHTHSEYATSTHTHSEYAESSHNHSASNITSGTLSSDRLPTVPLAKGGTGSTTAAGALTNLGITATASELNKLDGVTATTAELNYVDGVTSNIQTQLNGKQATISGGASTITSSNLTASRALVSNSSGKVAVSAVTSTQLGYLSSVTSDIQTQLNNKSSSTHTHTEYASSSHTHDEYASSSHTHDEYMGSSNPTGTGALSMNRKSGTIIGAYSVALGYNCTANSECSYAEGQETKASGSRSHAEGSGTTASGSCSHAEGLDTTASGVSSSHAEGNGTTSSGGYGSHAEGDRSVASGTTSHAEGCCTTASGDCSHSEGYYTTSLKSQHTQGHYNDTSKATAGTSSGTTGTAFVIGNGTSSSASNACRITYAGAVIGKAGYQASGADYAEYFEWADGNTENEERIGYFVTFDDGEFIRKANEGEYILGIVSGNPAVLGNNDECWRGQNEMDEWNRFIYVTETGTNEETGETYEYQTYKVNPDYDSTLQYVPRADRPEWDAVGMLGILSVRDDGTCQVNGYCKVADGGIATASDTGYRVIKRVTDNIIKVVFR